MVKTYSRKTDGNIQLSANFKVSEFACRDGSDKVLIDSRLVGVIQHIRDTLGKPININSGYRTLEHNVKIGGAKNSNHMNGTAADISIAGIDTVTVCKAAEKALAAQSIPGAIIRYHTKNNFVHVDVRASRLRQENDGKSAYNVSGWSETVQGSSPQTNGSSRPTLRLGSKGADVKVLQGALGGLAADGDFGAKTDAAVRAFQKSKGLTPVDGIVGAKTWAALGL